jgi:hypothetical protein
LRSFRNKPDSAKADAIYQTEVLVLIPTLSAAGLLYFVLASLLPNSFGLINPRAVQIVGFIGLTLSWLWLDSRLNHQTVADQLLQNFDGPLDRRTIVLFYSFDFICIPLVAWASYVFHGR